MSSGSGLEKVIVNFEMLLMLLMFKWSLVSINSSAIKSKSPVLISYANWSILFSMYNELISKYSGINWVVYIYEHESNSTERPWKLKELKCLKV